MATAATPDSLAGQARRLYTEELVKGLRHLVQATLDRARALLDKPSEHSALLRRRELLQGLTKGAQGWHRGMVAGLRRVLTQGGNVTRAADLPPGGGREPLTLVSDDTIEVEIVTSRLALAVMDASGLDISDNFVSLLGQWGMLVMSFYFGGRTLEKVMDMKAKK